jgi:hypothetical protein
MDIGRDSGAGASTGVGCSEAISLVGLDVRGFFLEGRPRPFLVSAGVGFTGAGPSTTAGATAALPNRKGGLEALLDFRWSPPLGDM